MLGLWSPEPDRVIVPIYTNSKSLAQGPPESDFECLLQTASCSSRFDDAASIGLPGRSFEPVSST
jgi:hypothetical protein